jgi:hypothetical protein
LFFYASAEAGRSPALINTEAVEKETAMFKTPSQNLVLNVFLATSLAGFAFNEAAEKKFLSFSGDAVLASVATSDAVKNYRKVKEALAAPAPRFQA